LQEYILPASKIIIFFEWTSAALFLLFPSLTPYLIPGQPAPDVFFLIIRPNGRFASVPDGFCLEISQKSLRGAGLMA